MMIYVIYGIYGTLFVEKWIDGIYHKMVNKPLKRVYLFIYNIRTYRSMGMFSRLAEFYIRSRKSHKSHKSFFGV